MQRILIVGAGFAGMYAGLCAARLREEQGVSPDALEIVVVAPEPRLVIRPRLYERAPETMVAPLLEVFEAVDVRFERGRVDVIDSAGTSAVIVMPADAPALKIQNTRGFGAEVVLYDRLKEDRVAIGRAPPLLDGDALVYTAAGLPPQRSQDPVGGIHPLQVAQSLEADALAGGAVAGMGLDAADAPVLHLHPQAAGGVAVPGARRREERHRTVGPSHRGGR